MFITALVMNAPDGTFYIHNLLVPIVERPLVPATKDFQLKLKFSSVVGLVTNNFFIHHHSELLIQIYQFLLHKMRPKNIYIPGDNLPGSTVLTKGCYEYRLVFE